MTVWYNEHDPKAAAWLRTLIKEKVIPDGEVDERSIEDVRPADLGGFVQCHFFAGIGGWAEALTLAGWPVDRPVWTGSCPCQSFSAAGTRTGFADERHLWPAWFHLIEQRRPPVIFGEQVDAAIRHGWLDLVQADLEALGYALGRAVVPAAGVGAPHGRHRLWFVADADYTGPQRRGERWDGADQRTAGPRGMAGELAHADGWNAGAEGLQRGGQHGQQPQDSLPGSMVEPESEQAWISRLARERRKTGGIWTGADWIYCRDDKWRPVEPGTFPLAHGLPARVGRLRGYGNAIVPQVAAEFVMAFTETKDAKP